VLDREGPDEESLAAAEEAADDEDDADADADLGGAADIDGWDVEGKCASVIRYRCLGVDCRVEVTAEEAADDEDDADDDLGGAADIDGWDVEGAFGLERLVSKDLEWHTSLLCLFCAPARHGANGVGAVI
jgi:hypothetical protein